MYLLTDEYVTNQVNGAGSVCFNVKTEMFHELDVVHVNLLAQVTLERHVGLELARQNLKNKMERN